MIEIDPTFQPLLMEALEELMYKLSLELDKYKGGPLTGRRKTLTEKQQQLEELQRQISVVRP